MKKRMISIFLCIIILSSQIVANASLGYDEIPSFLQAADIINKVSDDIDSFVTRGDFAMLAAKLVNLDNYTPQVTNNIFIDVPTDNECFKSIQTLKELGIISGSGNGLFEPYEPITLEAASKILIHILGYEYMAINDNYSVVANKKKLLNGVETSDKGNLTYDNVYKMIYNTLEANISASNTVDGFAENSGNDIFMSKRLGIYKIEGIVTDNGATSLYGDPSVDEGNLVIGGTKFANDSGITDVVGYNVTAYYRHDNSHGKDRVIYIYSDNTKTLTISSEDLYDYDKSSYTYSYYRSDDATKKTKARISTAYSLIYNGRLFSADTVLPDFTYNESEMMIPSNGYVTLIDSDGNNVYDIVSIWDYKNYLVSAIDSKNFIIYGDKDFTPGNINLKSAENSLNVVSNADTRVSFSNIRVDDVASVALSADGKHADIRISIKRINEYITAEDDYECQTENNSYYLSAEYKKYKNDNQISMSGKTASMYLAFDDRVVCIKNSKQAGRSYARLIALGVTSSLSAKVEAKVITQDNALSIYTIADNVKIDGKKYEKYNAQEIFDYLNNFNAESEFYGLIVIGFNSENEINYIDTPYYESLGNPNSAYESNDSLHVISGAEKQVVQCISGIYSFDGNFMANTNSMRLSIGDNAEKAEDDTVFTTITDNKTVKSINGLIAEYIGFSMTAGTGIADIVIVVREHSLNVFNGTQELYVVLGVTDCINSNGDTVKKITVTDGRYIRDYMTESEDTLICKCGSVYCSNTPIVVDRGDIVRFYLNQSGVIPNKGIFVMYDKSTDTQWSYLGELLHDGTPKDPNRKILAISDFRVKYALLKGELLDSEDQCAYWNIDYFPFRMYAEYRGGIYTTTPGSDMKKYFSMRDAHVIEVDLKRGTFENLLTSDIVPNNGKTYLLLTNKSVPYCIVSYAE